MNRKAIESALGDGDGVGVEGLDDYDIDEINREAQALLELVSTIAKSFLRDRGDNAATRATLAAAFVSAVSTFSPGTPNKMVRDLLLTALRVEQARVYGDAAPLKGVEILKGLCDCDKCRAAQEYN